MHPSDIQTLLKNHPSVISKYEDFMVRRVLLGDSDSRWCPAPDCGFAVIATGCASCPRLKCERPGCNLLFCYHCKAEWHPDATCDDARKARRSPTRQTSGSSDSQHREFHYLFKFVFASFKIHTIFFVVIFKVTTSSRVQDVKY